MAEKGSTRLGQPSEVGECSEPVAKRIRSECESAPSEGVQDAPGASVMETMFAKALMTIANRLTKLEEDRSGSGEGTPHEGM